MRDKWGIKNPVKSAYDWTIISQSSWDSGVFGPGLSQCREKEKEIIEVYDQKGPGKG